MTGWVMTKNNKPRVTWANGILHIEADGCTVNIRQGIRCNGNGATATVIEVLADGERYPSQNPWWIDDSRGAENRVLRIVQRDCGSAPKTQGGNKGKITRRFEIQASKGTQTP